MDGADISIRTVHTANEMHPIVTLLQQVWGSPTPIVAIELMMSISHGGGYIAAVYDDDRPVGASFGFLADHRGERALHSHVTGLLPGVQRGGIGQAIKNHQRSWAAEREIPWIVWTFDPLERRTARFNIEALGTHVTEYLIDFYGSGGDGAPPSDLSDRLVAAWPTGDAAPQPAAAGSTATTYVATPDEIAVLRRTNPSDAIAWRLRVRDELEPLVNSGGVITAVTDDGSYVVQHQA